MASIYERLKKAKQLIAEKIDKDMQKDEIKEIFEGFTTEEINRFKAQANVERFKLFINAVIGTLSLTPNKKLDPS